MGCVSAKKFNDCKEGRIAPEKSLAQGTAPDPQERSQTTEYKATLPSANSPGTTVRQLNQQVAPVAELMMADQQPPAKVNKTLPPRRVLVAEEDEGVTPEAPPRFTHKRKDSLDSTRRATMPNLPHLHTSSSDASLLGVKNISGVKSTFDKSKFKAVNPTEKRTYPQLPATVEEKLEEIELFGTVPENPQPLSSLKLEHVARASDFTGSGVPILVRPAGRQSLSDLRF